MRNHQCIHQDKWEEYLEMAEDHCFSAGMDPEKTSVKGMLNRLLGMPVDVQNRLFSHFQAPS